MGRDDDDAPERERPSWREIDRRRDGSRPRDEREPRGAAARARAAEATRQYLKDVDGIFSGSGGGAEAEKLARAVREAHGTPALDGACRSFRDAVGAPGDPGLYACFLDASDPELVLWALEAMSAAHAAGALEVGAGQRTQLRTLALGADDSVAEACEALLERLGA